MRGANHINMLFARDLERRFTRQLDTTVLIMQLSTVEGSPVQLRPEVGSRKVLTTTTT